MKVFPITVCILTIVIVSTWQSPRADDFLKYAEECKKKTKANDEDVQRMVVQRQAPVTREGSCFLACVKKSSGTMCADNSLNMTVAVENFAHLKETDKKMYDTLLRVFTECQALETPEKDECVAAKNFGTCIVAKKGALMKL